MPYEPLEPFEFGKYETPQDGMAAFFDYMWGLEHGYAHLAVMDKNKGWLDKRAVWPQRREQIVDWVLEQNSLGNNTYYGPALFDIDKVKAFEPTKSPYVKENIKGSHVIWVEHDGSPEALERALTALTPDLDTDTRSTPEAARGTLSGSTSIPVPSMRVQSSLDGREHWYWKLDEFESDSAWVESMNRSICYATRADTSGWDITQVLRPPYTTNHKYAQKPPVTIAYYNDRIFEHTHFAEVPAVKQLVSAVVDVDNLPSVERLLLKYAWGDDAYDLFSKDHIEVGERSYALMRLGYVCAENGLKEAEIYAMLLHADRKWEKYFKRSDRHARYLDIVNRALAKHPKALSETTFQGLINPNEDQDIPEPGYDVIDFLEIEEETNWAITDILDWAGLGLMASAPGVGKTQASLQLGYCCATGMEYLQWKPVKPMRIMFYSIEMSKASLRMFMKKQLAEATLEERKLLKDNMRVVFPDSYIPLDSNNDAKLLFEGQVAKFRPDGIIIDSLGKLTSGKLDEEACRKINNFLTMIRRKYNCFVWLIHHNRKASADNKRPNSLDDIYGSVYITAEATVAMTLWKPTPFAQEIELITNKNRLAEMPPVLRLERSANLLFSIKDRYITDASFQNVTKGGEDAGEVGSQLDM